MLNAAVLCLLTLTPAADPPLEPDFVIKDVLICDGTGQPPKCIAKDCRRFPRHHTTQLHAPIL